MGEVLEFKRHGDEETTEGVSEFTNGDTRVDPITGAHQVWKDGTWEASEEVNTTEDNNGSYILTEEDKANIANAVESSSSSEETNTMQDIENNGVQSEEPEHGEFKQVTVAVNPETGAQTMEEEIKPHSNDINDIVANLSNIPDPSEEDEDTTPINITPADIKKVAEDDTVLGKFDITEETCLELLKVINKNREDHTVATYSQMPEQVKGFINKYLQENGMGGYNVQANTVRNKITQALMEDFLNNIELNKYVDDFNDQIEHVYDDAGKELSPMIKEYNDSREETLKLALEKIEDPERKLKVQSVIDSIRDAYNLDRMKNTKIKIKHYYLVSPEKEFKNFLLRYQNSSAHIYDMKMLLPVLQKHLVSNGFIKEDDTTTAIKFILAFCLFSRKYDPSIPEEHAFMYYVTYNIVLLNIYFGDNYTEFAKPFLQNIMDVVNNSVY